MTDVTPTPSYNRRVVLESRPVALPGPENVSLRSEPLGPVAQGGVLVRNRLLSLDPTIRTWMDEGKNYMPPIAVGDVVRALGIGEVVASRSVDFAVGDTVMGIVGVQEYVERDGASAADPSDPTYLVKLDPVASSPEAALSTFGVTGGMTAYFGLLDIGVPKPGETVVVSAAAGSVGSIVGQIAKIKGCRVVGVAGGIEKCRYVVDELGFDACVDHHAADLCRGLLSACPDGIDVYFDNVGGETLDVVLEQINLKARIVLCGAISQYNRSPMRGPDNYFSLFVNRARMEGVLCLDYAERFPEAVAEMVGWLQAGSLKPARVQTEQGIDQFLPAFLRLFSGEHDGKLLLAV